MAVAASPKMCHIGIDFLRGALESSECSGAEVFMSSEQLYEMGNVPCPANDFSGGEEEENTAEPMNEGTETIAENVVPHDDDVNAPEWNTAVPAPPSATIPVDVEETSEHSNIDSHHDDAQFSEADGAGQDEGVPNTTEGNNEVVMDWRHDDDNGGGGVEDGADDGTDGWR